MKVYTAMEQYLLSLAVPNLELPALENPTQIDLHERASALDYGEANNLAPRGETNLEALLKVYGVVPSTLEERLAVIHLPDSRSTGRD
ncbi:MAG: hypothetical protein ACRD2G_17995 [Terriglobia bacterium]